MRTTKQIGATQKDVRRGIQGRMKREFCIWLVPGAQGRVRKLRLSVWQFVLLMALCVAGVSSVFYVTGDYARLQAIRAKNYLFLRHVRSERDKLEIENQTLASEVENLKDAQALVKQYESEIRRRVDELGTILQAATSIGLESQNEEKSVGGIDTAENEGVGGLEVDCELENGCQAEIEEAIQGPDLETLRLLHGENVPKESLVQTLAEYIRVVRTLPLGFPVGGDISSGYGFRVSPFSKSVRFHKGVDFSLPQGSYIFSTADGVVSKVERTGTYGLVVDISHGRGILTRYAHLSRAMVKEGQVVQRGEVIAHVGSTGRSTGPHLHYEIRVNGKAKNPGKFMELAYRLHGILS